MLCPSCNKFAAYDTSAEPETELQVESALEESDENTINPNTATATVDGTVRILLTSECCGEELREANLEVDSLQIEVERAKDCTCDLTELEVEASGEISDRNESTSTRTKKDGTVVTKAIPYRYQKRFFGAALEITVNCHCGKTTASANWNDEVQASGMDELT